MRCGGRCALCAAEGEMIALGNAGGISNLEPVSMKELAQFGREVITPPGAPVTAQALIPASKIVTLSTGVEPGGGLYPLHLVSSTGEAVNKYVGPPGQDVVVTSVTARFNSRTTSPVCSPRSWVSTASTSRSTRQADKFALPVLIVSLELSTARVRRHRRRATTHGPPPGSTCPTLTSRSRTRLPISRLGSLTPANFTMRHLITTTVCRTQAIAAIRSEIPRALLSKPLLI
jgi:hypothetical protein